MMDRLVQVQKLQQMAAGIVYKFDINMYRKEYGDGNSTMWFGVDVKEVNDDAHEYQFFMFYDWREQDDAEREYAKLCEWLKNAGVL